MSNDAYFLQIMAKERHNEFQRDARMRRLRMSHGKPKPGIRETMWIRAGEFLIRQGEAMKYRYVSRPCMADGGSGLTDRE
ncbi:MAG: hypothetical protein MI802_02190 [Desulfobacterales bacterium]|nr:hypothetical protein [Desulfobacterales bacterium]